MTNTVNDYSTTPYVGKFNLVSGSDYEYLMLFKRFLAEIDINRGVIDAMAFEMLQTLKAQFDIVQHIDANHDGYFNNLFDYYNRTVLPHKVAVYQFGMDIVDFFDLQTSDVRTQLIYHDLSKFSMAEAAYAFVDFANFKDNPPEVIEAFNDAWFHHKSHNPHHPEYWWNVSKGGNAKPVEMPNRYVAEMVADWLGAGVTYGNSLEDWFKEKGHEFTFHPKTAERVALVLTRAVGLNCQAGGVKVVYLKKESPKFD